MNYFVYCFYDKVSGVYGEPFLAVNVGVAQRKMKSVFCQNLIVAADIALYKIGQFDVSTGQLVGLEQPEFVSNYVFEDNG